MTDCQPPLGPLRMSVENTNETLKKCIPTAASRSLREATARRNRRGCSVAAAAEAAAAVEAAAAAEVSAAAGGAAKAAAYAPGAQAALAPELLKEPGGGAGGMAEDAEEIPGRPVFSVGARVRVLRATAPGILPRLATGYGEAADAPGAEAALVPELSKEPGGVAGGMAEDAEEIPGRPE